jgi:hypothetical protein
MISGDLYHGTSSGRWEEIRSHGFQLAEGWDKWLCARGVYCVYERPLVAYYFATWAAHLDNTQKRYPRDSTPVVLRVHTRDLGQHEVLDLTTDKGMAEFYHTYESFRRDYDEPADFLAEEPEVVKPNETVPFQN